MRRHWEPAIEASRISTVYLPIKSKLFVEEKQSTCLIMKSWFRQAFLYRLILVKDVPKILYCRSDDTAASRRANDKIKRPILDKFHDSWGDGRQGPFARLDEVGR